MGILDLLKQAEQAGMTVKVEGGKLTIKGDKKYAAIAQELGKRKKEVVEYFDAPRVAQFSYIGTGTGTDRFPEEKQGCGATPPQNLAQPGEAQSPLTPAGVRLHPVA